MFSLVNFIIFYAFVGCHVAWDDGFRNDAKIHTFLQ